MQTLCNIAGVRISLHIKKHFYNFANIILPFFSGMDFFALARGGERSYSTSFLINLDPDLLTLCAAESQTAFDLSLNGLVIQFHTYASITLDTINLSFLLWQIGHTNRIFRMIQGKSKRNINQFCFGSVVSSLYFFYLGLSKTIISLLLQYVQLNPNYRKFGKFFAI